MLGSINVIQLKNYKTEMLQYVASVNMMHRQNWLKQFCTFQRNREPYYLHDALFKNNTSHRHTTRKQYNMHQMRPNHDYAILYQVWFAYGCQQH